MKKTCGIEQNGNIVNVSGNVCFSSVSKLVPQLKKLLKKYNKAMNPSTSQVRIKLDFQNVNDCDSSAVAFMIEAHRIAKEQSFAIEYTNLPQKLINLVTVSGLDSNTTVSLV